MNRLTPLPAVAFDSLPPRRSAHPAVLLIERKGALPARRLRPMLPVVAVSGRMTAVDAERVAAVSSEWVYVWPTAGWHPDQGPHPQAASITRLLHAAGVEDVLLIAHEGESDRPEVLIERYGVERATRRFAALLRSAEFAGPYSPNNPYDCRNVARAVAA
jgi:hypothetical protein